MSIIIIIIIKPLAKLNKIKVLQKMVFIVYIYIYMIYMYIYMIYIYMIYILLTCCIGWFTPPKDEG